MKIQVNNFSMAYDESGEGMPLVFVHGYPLNRKIWAPQVAGLSQAARVLAPDLRSHGESEVIAGPNWMDVFADDLNSFLQALGISRPVVLCGLSMGGYVAFAFYRKHAPRLAGLILASTKAAADSQEARQNRDKQADLARQKGVGAVAEAMLPKLLAQGTLDSNPRLVDEVRAILESTPLEGMVGDLQGLKERPDSTGTLGEIEVPTLIIHGADDQIIPVKEAEAMHKAIRASRLEVIQGAGHLLNMEQPERFNAAVESFLEAL